MWESGYAKGIVRSRCHHWATRYILPECRSDDIRYNSYSVLENNAQPISEANRSCTFLTASTEEANNQTRRDDQALRLSHACFADDSGAYASQEPDLTYPMAPTSPALVRFGVRLVLPGRSLEILLVSIGAAATLESAEKAVRARPG